MSKINDMTGNAKDPSSVPLTKISETEVREITQWIENLRLNIEYFAGAIALEQKKFEQSSKTVSDALRARAFCSAHAGLHSQAIEDLNALTSQSSGATAENLIKFAQVLVRRGAEQANKITDLAMAVDIARAALGKIISNDERFMANYVMATAEYHRGNLAASKSALDVALSIKGDDERAKTLAVLISSSAVDDANAKPGVAQLGVMSANLLTTLSTGTTEKQRNALAGISVLRNEMTR